MLFARRDPIAVVTVTLHLYGCLGSSKGRCGGRTSDGGTDMQRPWPKRGETCLLRERDWRQRMAGMIWESNVPRGLGAMLIVACALIHARGEMRLVHERVACS